MAAAVSSQPTLGRQGLRVPADANPRETSHEP
jgi:hypothetical protein